MRRGSFIAVALFAFGARADSFADLKLAVERLGAHQSVRVTYATVSVVKASGRFSNESTQTALAAEVVHDANGVTITIPQPLIEKVSRGLAAADAGAQNAISSIRTLSVVEALDFREPLMNLLRHATVMNERRVIFRGRQTRLLVLKLAVLPRKGNGITIGSSKVGEDRLSVWMADDSLPLAAERTQKTTAGFLIFHADTEQRTGWTFTQSGDRLILSRLESHSTGSAMGQQIDESFVQTVVVR